MRPEDTRCDRGQVLDLSLGGMRLRGRWLNPQLVHAVRMTCTGESVAVRAEVVWQQKRGWFTWEMGLKFVQVDPRTMTALERLVILSRQRRTM
jgi:c-di-GMP-binding flagellar brake protein YcgR